MSDNKAGTQNTAARDKDNRKNGPVATKAKTASSAKTSTKNRTAAKSFPTARKAETPEQTRPAPSPPVKVLSDQKPAMKTIDEITTGFVPNGHKGSFGKMRMVSIADILIDSRFHRGMSLRSVRTVRNLCENFNLAHFAPVILYRNGDNLVVVDGHVRLTAAKTVGLKKVPCYIVDLADTSEGAAAFSWINDCVTPLAPYDKWIAMIVARDPQTLELKQILDREGITVVQHNENLSVGETSAISALRQARHRYGDTIFSLILRCITRTGNGNPGMLFGSPINGVGRALHKKPDIAKKENALYRVFDAVDITSLVAEARMEARMFGARMEHVITREINAIMREKGGFT